MKKFNDLLDLLQKRLFSNTFQIQRIIVLTAIALGLTLVSFSGYYYYDRYYQPPREKKSEVTLSEAEQAVRDNPSDETARMNLAENYMLNRRFDEAVEQALQVKQLFPKNAMTDYVIGISYANSGKCPEALEPLINYINAYKDQDMPGLDRRLQAGAYYLGDCYLQLSQPQEAIGPLEMAVDWSRTDADAMYKLGMAYAGVNDNEKAVNMFHAATAFVPTYMEAYAAMETSYLAMNNSARATYAHGMLEFSQQNYDSALQTLQKAAEADPSFPPTMLGLGMVYEALGDLENAKKFYELTVTLDPNNFTASTSVQRVETLLNNR